MGDEPESASYYQGGNAGPQVARILARQGMLI